MNNATMRENPIVYRPFKWGAWVLIATILFCEILMFSYTKDLFVNFDANKLEIVEVLAAVIVMSIVQVFYYKKSKEAILFFDEYFIIKNIRGKKYMKIRYDEMNAYYYKNYKNFIHLILSDEEFKTSKQMKTLSKKVFFDRILYGRTVIIILSDHKYEQELTELIERNYPHIEKLN